MYLIICDLNVFCRDGLLKLRYIFDGTNARVDKLYCNELKIMSKVEFLT